MIWKFLKQNVLFPKGLNWVQHWVSRIGLLGVYGLVRWVNKWCHQKYAQMRKNCALRYSADEGVVRPRGSILWYYLFVHNCSASYLTKCSEPKEFYLSLHLCVFLVLFRLLAQVRATRTWTTHFSHLVTVRESTLRTRVAPMMFVFLLEKE